MAKSNLSTVADIIANAHAWNLSCLNPLPRFTRTLAKSIAYLEPSRHRTSTPLGILGKLPPELRLAVYEYCAENAITPLKKADHIGLGNTAKFSRSNLLYINRQIRSEHAPVYRKLVCPLLVLRPTVEGEPASEYVLKILNLRSYPAYLASKPLTNLVLAIQHPNPTIFSDELISLTCDMKPLFTNPGVQALKHLRHLQIIHHMKLWSTVEYSQKHMQQLQTWFDESVEYITDAIKDPDNVEADSPLSTVDICFLYNGVGGSRMEHHFRYEKVGAEWSRPAMFVPPFPTSIRDRELDLECERIQ